MSLGSMENSIWMKTTHVILLDAAVKLYLHRTPVKGLQAPNILGFSRKLVAGKQLEQVIFVLYWTWQGCFAGETKNVGILVNAETKRCPLG